MMRKMLAVLTLAGVGLFTMGGVAAAAPAPVKYPPVPPVINIFVTVNINIVIINNGIVIFSGGGFDALEGINISVLYSAPSGLRSTPALAAKSSAKLTTSADSAGSFSEQVPLTQLGTATLTATGSSSGKTASLTVQVKPVGTVVAPDATGTTSYSVVGGATGTTGSSSAALASTGASVAGPIAIGAAALFAGLAMLFFGTRGVIRRKGSRSGGTA